MRGSFRSAASGIWRWAGLSAPMTSLNGSISPMATIPGPSCSSPNCRWAIERYSRFTIGVGGSRRSEEHTSELQSLMRISYAVFCLKKKKNYTTKDIKNILTHHTQYKHNNTYKHT